MMILLLLVQTQNPLWNHLHWFLIPPITLIVAPSLSSVIGHLTSELITLNSCWRQWASREQMETWHLTIIKRLDTNVERLPLNHLRQGCSSAIKNHQTPDNELGGEVGFHAEDCLLRTITLPHYPGPGSGLDTGHGERCIRSRTHDFRNWMSVVPVLAFLDIIDTIL